MGSMGECLPLTAGIDNGTDVPGSVYGSGYEKRATRIGWLFS